MGPSWGLGPAGGAESVKVCSACSQSWGGLGRWGAQKVPWPQLVEPEIHRVSKAMSPTVPMSPAPTARTHPAPPAPGETLEVGTQPWASLRHPNNPPCPSPHKAIPGRLAAPSQNGGHPGCTVPAFPWIPAFRPAICQASPWAVLPLAAWTPQTPKEPLRPKVPCGPTPRSHSVGASVEGVRR